MQIMDYKISQYKLIKYIDKYIIMIYTIIKLRNKINKRWRFVMSKKIYGQELINSLNEELKRISNLRIKRLDQDVSECGLSNYFDNIRESEIKRQLNILKMHR